MPRPLLKVEDLGTIDTALDASARDVIEGDLFGDGHGVFCGLTQGAWRGDFTEEGGCWDRIIGGWTGPAPVRAVGANLRTLQFGTESSIDKSGAHPISEIASNGGFLACCEIIEVNDLRFPAMMIFRLWDAATDAVVDSVQVQVSGANDTIMAPFAAVAAGSYQLGAHFIDATKTPIEESFYKSLTGITVSALFRYTESGTRYFYDYKRNLGRLPSNETHALRNARSDVIAANTQLDRPEWADYITSGGDDEGEWSQIRIIAGAGTWAAGVGLFPCPGPALRKRLNDTTWDGVAFDTMARCIGASFRIRVGKNTGSSSTDTQTGDWLIAGMMSMKSGPVAALWRIRGGSTVLLGWNRDPSDGRCQCAKRNHGINSIIELADGTVMLLSECSLLKYNYGTPDLSERIVGYPYHGWQPGGYSLRMFSDDWNFFTENFSPSPPGEINFYNRLQEFTSGRQSTGPGTVWHGRECSAGLWGKLWGWQQDAPFEDETATVALSYLSQGHWQRDSYAPSLATQYRWKSLLATGGKLLASGIEPNTGKELSRQECKLETGGELRPLWGIDSGREWREFYAPFFPLYLSQCVDTSGQECALAVARAVVKDEFGTPRLTAPEHIIRIYPQPVKVCSTWGEVPGEGFGFVWLDVDLEAAGCDLDKLPPYLVWQADLRVEAGGSWLASATAPESGPFLGAVGVTGGTAYVASGTMPYDTGVWNELCFTIYEDGTIIVDPPGNNCPNADCAKTKMPDSVPLFVSPDLQNRTWEAVQVGDVNALDINSDRILERTVRLYPALWLRVDSSADRDDLTSYTHRIGFNRFESLPKTAFESIDVVVIVPAGSGDVRAPIIDRCG